jgi:TetR/AcrR family transcriptional regulator
MKTKANQRVASEAEMPPALSDKKPSDRTAETRARILDSALKEFSAKGLAGARTEQIATAAGVNKALLYYYFDSKEKLYEAALESVATRVRETTLAVLEQKASAGERVLRAALNHFDRILTQREFQSLMQQEMMRLHRGEEGAVGVLVERIFRPLMMLFQATVQEGIASGELIEADWMQFQLSVLGANVFYFLSAPVWRMMLDVDPFSEAALKARRVALVEFLGQSIFRDRKRGARIAERVLKNMPAPDAVALKTAHYNGTKSKR